MIEETMLHGRVVSGSCRLCRRSYRGRTFRPAAISSAVDSPGPVSKQPERHPRGLRIDWDTIIIPRAVAEGGCEEVQVWMGTALPSRWVRELVGYANTVYAHNERFRRRINGKGNRGRDYLWVFMRHWLAALLRRHKPDLFARLPASYCIGHALPIQRHTPGQFPFSTRQEPALHG